MLADRGLRLAGFGCFGHMWELYATWAWFVVFFTLELPVGGAEKRQTGAQITDPYSPTHG